MMDAALSQYVKTQSPDAFKMLVDRHGNAVYAQCVRQLRDPHLAEDVTQAVFMVLARKARSLPASVVLPAWLFKVTRYACANARRSENRRRRYEQEAAMTRELQRQQAPDAALTDLDLALDEALARLGKVDRQAVVLRFYSGMNTAEVGENLGMSPDTAKRRISRAVEKLRNMLMRRGVTVAPSVLLMRLDGLAIHSTPIDLSTRIVAHALNPAAVSPSCATIAKGAIQMMHLAQIKIGVVATLMVLAAGAGAAALTGALEQDAPPAVAATQPIDPGQIAADQALVRSTIERFAQAIRSHDLKALDQCMSVAADDDGALIKAMILENVGYRHFQTAWASKFKEPLTTANITFVWVPELDGGAESLLELALANVKDADIQVTGTVARMPLKFGQYDKDLSQFRGYWVSLINDGVSWKIDMSRTLRINVNMTFKPGRQPSSADEESKIAINEKLTLARILDDTAVAIEKGDFGDGPAVIKRIKTLVSQSFDSYGLIGISYGFAAAKPTSIEQ